LAECAILQSYQLARPTEQAIPAMVRSHGDDKPSAWGEEIPGHTSIARNFEAMEDEYHDAEA
jgi:hypothetical protein